MMPTKSSILDKAGTVQNSKNFNEYQNKYQ